MTGTKPVHVQGRRPLLNNFYLNLANVMDAEPMDVDGLLCNLFTPNEESEAQICVQALAYEHR